MEPMKISPVLLLNSYISNLYHDEQIMSVRLYLSLSKLGVETFYEFVQLVNDSLEYKNHHLREALNKNLGGISRMEIRELFDQAGIEYPAKWLGV
jgi:hypothetical protein